jgi:hypothetical protein
MGWTHLGCPSITLYLDIGTLGAEAERFVHNSRSRCTISLMDIQHVQPRHAYALLVHLFWWVHKGMLVVPQANTCIHAYFWRNRKTFQRMWYMKSNEISTTKTWSVGSNDVVLKLPAAGSLCQKHCMQLNQSGLLNTYTCLIFLSNKFFDAEPPADTSTKIFTSTLLLQNHLRLSLHGFLLKWCSLKNVFEPPTCLAYGWNWVSRRCYVDKQLWCIIALANTLWYRLVCYQWISGWVLEFTW